MSRKFASTLAKEYEVGTNNSEFYMYIVESLINGNRQQVRDLFNQMRKHSQQEFLIDFLKPTEGYDKSVLNICIEELINNS
jgi:hypothetical protein